MDITDIIAGVAPAIEWTYDKLFDVYEMQSYTKPNGADAKRLTVTIENQTCRISINKRQNTAQGEGNLNTNSHILFCSPDVEIPTGSKIVLKSSTLDSGQKYESTEEPMKYASHQEVQVNKHEWV